MDNQEIFEKIAATYDSEERQKVNEQIVKEINKNLEAVDSKGTLLDFGCGTGEIGLKFLEQFTNVLFLDASKNMLAIVEAKLAALSSKKGQTLLADGRSGDSELADCIIVSQVLLHIVDTEEILRHLARMLKEQGTLLIVDYDKNPDVHSDKIHNGFDQQELAKCLKKIGFSTVVSHNFYQQDQLLMGKPATLFIMKAHK